MSSWNIYLHLALLCGIQCRAWWQLCSCTSCSPLSLSLLSLPLSHSLTLSLSFLLKKNWKCIWECIFAWRHYRGKVFLWSCWMKTMMRKLEVLTELSLCDWLNVGDSTQLGRCACFLQYPPEPLSQTEVSGPTQDPRKSSGPPTMFLLFPFCLFVCLLFMLPGFDFPLFFFSFRVETILFKGLSLIPCSHLCRYKEVFTLNVCICVSCVCSFLNYMLLFILWLSYMWEYVCIHT